MNTAVLVLPRYRDHRCNLSTSNSLPDSSVKVFNSAGRSPNTVERETTIEVITKQNNSKEQIRMKKIPWYQAPPSYR